MVIPNPDGGVRLCIDYKRTLNDQLVASNFPMKKIYEITDSLRDSRYFCKLDLYKAYIHFLVDDASSKLQTISTHRGTYRMKRLSYGIKTAPAEFNRAMHRIMQGLSGVEMYFDDLLVHGKSYEECYNNLRLCLMRLSENEIDVSSASDAVVAW